MLLIRITTNRGYTLVEVLVTMAIMGAVAIPLAMFLSSVINKMTSDAVLEASAIAANYMDQTISQSEYSNEDFIYKIGSRSYIVEKKCVSENNIMSIFIKVRKSENLRVLFTLYRGVYVPENQG